MQPGNIQKILTGAVGIGILLLVVTGIAIYFISQQSQTTINNGGINGNGSLQNNQNTTGGQTQNNGGTSVSGTNSSTGGSTGTGSRIQVAGTDGQTYEIKDFKNDPATLSDKNNPGQYILAGGRTPSPLTTPFSILYIDSIQNFNITLLREPIGDIRLQAEQLLLQRLGISQEKMCGLRYSVGVPESVNSFYAGKNLGFSFCPGAVKL